MRFWEIVSEMDRAPASDMDERKIREGIRLARAYQSHGGAKPFGTVAGVDVLTDADREWFTFVVDGEALGYAMLEPNRKPALPAGFYMSEIGLLPRLRGKGIGLGFYCLVLDRGETIMSGAQQTPDGEKVWRRLMAMPDVKVEAARLTWDGDEMGCAPVTLSEIKPWSDSDYFLIARKR